MSNGKLEYSRGDVLDSKYEVTDRLDETAIGVTYRVKHIKSGKFVRLTVLRSEITEQTTPEALTEAFHKGKDLRNPHLVRLGELGNNAGARYFTWEDFESKNLRELMQEYKVSGRNFGLKDAAQVVNQVLEALTTLHGEGVFFRALRPEHILVNVRYAGPRQQNFVAHVKLFGACLWDLVPTGALVEDEYARGEAQYLAPELKSFEPVATMRSDIYSSGVVFYEMLSGTAPVGTFMPLTQQRPELPKLVDDVVELAMAHPPDDRYRSARDLSSGIQRVFEAAATEPTEEARTGPLVLAIAAIGALLVVAVAVGVYAIVNQDSAKSDQVDDQRIRMELREAHSNPTDAERSAMQSRHPKGMIYVPGGPYLSGRLNVDPFSNKGAEPLHERVELKGFMIDAFEHPNALHGTPKSKVTWDEARQTCESQGKRLCSAQEWEKSCKGPGNFVYSYGDTFDPEFCGDGLPSSYTSGQFPECRSGYGAFDLSGGLREWTASAPDADKNRRVVKGGALSSAEKGSRCAFSTDESSGYTHSTLSFRCCRDADAPPIEAAPPAPAEDAAPEGP
ncbi:MAG: SUMF1/EgtB/PvdO family nonheme iron enzyme [Myxococcota bacterium]